jgi:hypothetical protein
MLEHAMFDRLPVGSQIDVLAQKGTVLAQRQHKEWSITLFSMHNYFVELWAKQELEIVGSFHKTANPMEILEPYMEGIDMEGELDV